MLKLTFDLGYTLGNAKADRYIDRVDQIINRWFITNGKK